MNRWPYQRVLCLVFNLDTEGERQRARDEDKGEKEESYIVFVTDTQKWNH